MFERLVTSELEKSEQTCDPMRSCTVICTDPGAGKTKPLFDFIVNNGSVEYFYEKNTELRSALRSIVREKNELADTVNAQIQEFHRDLERMPVFGSPSLMLLEQVEHVKLVHTSCIPKTLVIVQEHTVQDYKKFVRKHKCPNVFFITDNKAPSVFFSQPDWKTGPGIIVLSASRMNIFANMLAQDSTVNVFGRVVIDHLESCVHTHFFFTRHAVFTWYLCNQVNRRFGDANGIRVIRIFDAPKHKKGVKLNVIGQYAPSTGFRCYFQNCVQTDSVDSLAKIYISRNAEPVKQSRLENLDRELNTCVICFDSVRQISVLGCCQKPMCMSCVDMFFIVNENRDCPNCRFKGCSLDFMCPSGKDFMSVIVDHVESEAGAGSGPGSSKKCIIVCNTEHMQSMKAALQYKTGKVSRVYVQYDTLRLWSKRKSPIDILIIDPSARNIDYWTHSGKGRDGKSNCCVFILDSVPDETKMYVTKCISNTPKRNVPDVVVFSN